MKADSATFTVQADVAVQFAALRTFVEFRHAVAGVLDGFSLLLPLVDGADTLPLSACEAFLYPSLR